MGDIIILTLLMKKPSVRELEWLSQGHMDMKHQNWVFVTVSSLTLSYRTTRHPIPPKVFRKIYPFLELYSAFIYHIIVYFPRKPVQTLVLDSARIKIDIGSSCQ